MPVKPIALALAEGHQAAADARAVQRAASEAREARERQERASETLRNSPLYEWFPSTTFSIIDYTGVGTSLQYQSNGSDIIVESDDGVQFGLGIDHLTNEVQVHVVKLVQPAPAYAHEGPYYSGRIVESALEVGLWLEDTSERLA